MARIVQRDRFGERDLEAEVAGAAAEVGDLREARIAGVVVEEGVGPVVGAVGGAAENGAPRIGGSPRWGRTQPSLPQRLEPRPAR